MLIKIHKKTIAWKGTYLGIFLKNVPIPRLFIFIEKSMTYQKNVFFRVITFHNMSWLKRNVSSEYFSNITYKKSVCREIERTMEKHQRMSVRPSLYVCVLVALFLYTLKRLSSPFFCIKPLYFDMQHAIIYLEAKRHGEIQQNSK